jgi:hypothetical protein
MISYPPLVSRRTHYFTNGLIWLLAGINLIRLAIEWYMDIDKTKAIIGSLVTLSLGIYLSQTRFKIIAGKFNTRILGLPEKSWILAFQSIKSYILLSTMIMLGITFRVIIGLDEFYLALVYTTMGVVLFLASYFFFKPFFENVDLSDLKTNQ